ncbi:hypothetical protein BX666DRAFT_1852344 [Dichotomocladium elegans]|nr:hypothetical protein BX666DRAFT_1852344 [Dichotomocladium elegans]
MSPQTSSPPLLPPQQPHHSPYQQQQQQQHQQPQPKHEALSSLPESPKTLSSRSSSSVAIDTPVNEQLLDHSHLKPGTQASLLSYAQTITMYRENAKKTNNPDIQCDFAIFLVEAAKPLAEEDDTRQEYLGEAEKLLKQLGSKGHAESQYYLGNLYATGLLSKKAGKPDFDKAFPLFVQAAKHNHPDASYRTAKCYEEGSGTRKDNAKALQFYKKAATQSHPAAMCRLGMAYLQGELGLSVNVRESVKWLGAAVEIATPEFPQAAFELARLYETGVEKVVFVDHAYAISLYKKAAEELLHAPSAFKLGVVYEYGHLQCSPDPALSIHYYTIAAQQGHRDACFALTAWYLVGSPNILPQSDEQAYVWARRAAEMELPKAEYAVGYFTESGIGTPKNPQEAMIWYKRAAQHGDKRAIQRLQGKVDGDRTSKKKNGDDCSIM